MTLTRFYPGWNRLPRLFFVLALPTALGVGANLVGVSAAQAGQQDAKTGAAATYAIKHVYKVGETDRYRVITNLSGEGPDEGPVEVVWKLLFKEKTREVKADGSSTAVAEFEQASIEVNGAHIDATAMMPNLIKTRAKSGEFEVKLEGGRQEILETMEEMIGRITGTDVSVLLPAHPVKIGESWEVDPDRYRLDLKDLKVTGKSTLVSVETLKGAQVAKIKESVDITGAMETKQHFETIGLIEVATGKFVSLKTKITRKSSAGNFDFDTTLTRLAPGEKGDETETPKAESGVKKP